MFALSTEEASAADRAPPLDVAVLSLRGNAPEPLKERGTQALIEALRGIEGLRVISLANVAAVLGSARAAEIDHCADDACLLRATAQIRARGLIAGAIDVEPGRTVVRVRLIETSTSSSVVPKIARARVSHDVPDPSSESSLLAAIAGAAVDLFPDLADRTSGLLFLTGLIPGASIWVDGKVAAEVPLNSPRGESLLRLPVGSHEVMVRAHGHKPARQKVQVLSGHKTEAAFDLEKNRSSSPLILAGVGVVAGGAALALGLSARGIERDWQDACAGDACASGFTRARYESDRSTIDRERVSSNGLWIVSGVALAASVVWYLLDPGADQPETEGVP